VESHILHIVSPRRSVFGLFIHVYFYPHSDTTAAYAQSNGQKIDTTTDLAYSGKNTGGLRVYSRYISRFSRFKTRFLRVFGQNHDFYDMGVTLISVDACSDEFQC